MQFRFCGQDGPTNHISGCIHLFLLFLEGGELLKNVDISNAGINLKKSEKEEGFNFDQNLFMSIVNIPLRPML